MLALEEDDPMITRRTVVAIAPAMLALLLSGCGSDGGTITKVDATSDADLLALVGTWNITDGESITTGSPDAHLEIGADGTWRWEVDNDGEIDAYSGTWRFDDAGALEVDLVENDSTMAANHRDGFGDEHVYLPRIASLDDIGPAVREILTTDDLDRQEELVPEIIAGLRPFTALRQAGSQALLSLDWEGKPEDSIPAAIIEPSADEVRVWMDRDMEKFAEDDSAPPSLVYTRA